MEVKVSNLQFLVSITKNILRIQIVYVGLTMFQQVSSILSVWLPLANLAYYGIANV